MLSKSRSRSRPSGHGLHTPRVTEDQISKLTVHRSGQGPHTPRVTVDHNSKLTVHQSRSGSWPSGHGQQTPQVTVGHNSKLKVLQSKSRSRLSGHGPHTLRVTVGHNISWQLTGYSHGHDSPVMVHILRESLWTTTPSLQSTGHGHGHGPPVTRLHTTRVTVGEHIQPIYQFATDQYHSNQSQVILAITVLRSRSRFYGHGPHTPRVTVGQNYKLTVLQSQSRSLFSGHRPHTP